MEKGQATAQGRPAHITGSLTLRMPQSNSKSGAADYVAIIIDGNGRWAQARGLSPTEGHNAGAKILRERLYDAVELGIKELTVYSFSTENWRRSSEEITGLMRILTERLTSEMPALHSHGVRMRFIGRRRGTPDSLVRQMTAAEALTAHNRRLTFCIAFNYGARTEIVDAARAYKGGGEEEFHRLLYAPEMHDPELIIRTGGEQRLSNFLLWQAAFSEFIFRDEFWPDFTRAALEQSLAEFTARQRHHTIPAALSTHAVDFPKYKIYPKDIHQTTTSTGERESDEIHKPASPEKHSAATASSDPLRPGHHRRSQLDLGG